MKRFLHMTLVTGILLGTSLAHADYGDLGEVRNAWRVIHITGAGATCLEQKRRELVGQYGIGSGVGQAVESAVRERQEVFQSTMTENRWVSDVIREQGLTTSLLDPSGDVEREAAYSCKVSKDSLESKKDEALGIRDVNMYWPRFAVGALWDAPKGFFSGIWQIVAATPKAAGFVYGFMTNDGKVMVETQAVVMNATETVSAQVQEWQVDPNTKLIQTRDGLLALRASIGPRQSGSMVGGTAFMLVLTPAANWAGKGIQTVRSQAALIKTLQTEVNALTVENEMLWTENANLQRLAFRDPLTGAFTEAAFREGPLAKKVADLLASGDDVYALKFDVDHLKAANELVGHITGGDEVLRESAEHALMVASLRQSDIVVRSSTAGDEFLVLFKSDEAGAQGLAERLQQLRINSPARQKLVTTMMRRSTDGSIPERVISEAFRGSNGQIPANGNIGTLSIGITKYKQGEGLESFLTRADEALHQAKKIPGKGSVFALDAGK